MDKIRTAIITGGHDFEVIPFHHLFRSFDSIDPYIQHMEDFASSSQEVREWYDVVLFYNMYKGHPTEQGPGKQKPALEQLGRTEQGIVVLHHAVLSYQGWEIWEDIVDRDTGGFQFHHDQELPVSVADQEHAITQGLDDWTMQDETYELNAAGQESHVLLQTSCPNSVGNLAWVRRYRNSRVFCFFCGHDHVAWENPNFATVLHRGIEWTCGRR